MPRLYDLLAPLTKVKLNRLQRVMREGSPKYHYDVPAIAASAYLDFDVETQFPRAQKYAPLDSCLIINNDVVDIAIDFNGQGGNNYYLIPAGVIRQINRDELPAIWQLRIYNLDAVNAITVNTIDIELWRSPEDADSVARRSL